MKLESLIKILGTFDFPGACDVVIDEYNNLTVMSNQKVLVRLQIDKIADHGPEIPIVLADPAPAPGKVPAPVIDSDKFRYAGPGKKGIDWLLGRRE